jgi:hypothetical protein
MDRKKLALIHIIKKELKLSDTEYRNILQQAAGVQSAKDLNENTFRQLMSYFVRSPYYRANPYNITLRQKLYLQHLADDLGWDKEHLEKFISKYYHKSHVDWLSKKDAMKAIESLKQIKKRQS